MFEVLAFGGLIVAALMVAAVVGLVVLLVKGVILLVLLPLRLAFGLILLPFRLLGVLVALLLVPVIAVAGLLAAVRRRPVRAGRAAAASRGHRARRLVHLEGEDASGCGMTPFALEGVGGPQQRRLVEAPSNQLQPDRQPAGGQPARHRQRRQPGQRRAHREDVRQVHLERVVEPFAQRERRGRRRRQRDHVHPFERAVEVPPDQRAALLRPQVERVVVAGAERVGAEHDPPLHLGAEPLVARPLVHARRASSDGARNP